MMSDLYLTGREILWSSLDRLRLQLWVATIMRGASAFWGLVLPVVCVVCGRPDSSLCVSCSAAVRRLTVRPFNAEEGALSLPWSEEGRGTPGSLPDGTLADGPLPCVLADGSPSCVLPDASLPRVLPVVAAGRYGRQLSAVLLAFKNKGLTDLAPVLESALAGVLHVWAADYASGRGTGRGGFGGPLLIIPVPSRGSAVRRRGYDPVWLILSQLRRRQRLPVGTALLPAVHVHQLRKLSSIGVVGRFAAADSQKSLGRSGRSRNVAGTFFVAQAYAARVRGQHCLVVDDVLTTGATIAETVRALRVAGAHVVGGAVIAATPAPGGGGSPGRAMQPHGLDERHMKIRGIKNVQGVNKIRVWSTVKYGLAQ